MYVCRNDVMILLCSEDNGGGDWCDSQGQQNIALMFKLAYRYNNTSN